MRCGKKAKVGLACASLPSLPVLLPPPSCYGLAGVSFRTWSPSFQRTMRTRYGRMRHVQDVLDTTREESQSQRGWRSPHPPPLPYLLFPSTVASQPIRRCPKFWDELPQHQTLVKWLGCVTGTPKGALDRSSCGA